MLENKDLISPCDLHEEMICSVPLIHTVKWF